jgi:hypothetical protein
VLDPRQWAHGLRHERGHHDGWHIEQYVAELSKGLNWPATVSSRLFVQSGSLRIAQFNDQPARILPEYNDAGKLVRRDWEFEAVPLGRYAAEVLSERCIFHLALPIGADFESVQVTGSEC